MIDYIQRKVCILFFYISGVDGFCGHFKCKTSDESERRNVAPGVRQLRQKRPQLQTRAGIPSRTERLHQKARQRYVNNIIYVYNISLKCT